MYPMTSELRYEIKLRIKNKIDISDLIENVIIKGEDLSYAIISKFRRIDSDISRCNFSHCVLGNEKDVFTIIRCNVSGGNFDGVRFVGTTWMRSCNARGCNFRNADVSKVSYEHTDFRDSTFCGAIIRIGTKEGVGCQFPDSMWKDLTETWNIDLTVTPKRKE